IDLYLSPYKAYEMVVPEVATVPDDKLVAVNVDIPLAVSTVLTALPAITVFRPEVEKLIPSYDFSPFDKLSRYALATGHAHAMYLACSQPPEGLGPLAHEATEARDTLLLDAQALARHKL